PVESRMSTIYCGPTGRRFLATYARAGQRAHHLGIGDPEFDASAHHATTCGDPPGRGFGGAPVVGGVERCLTPPLRLCYGPLAVVNRVILVSNLGKDPGVRFTPNGKALAKFSVATSERWTDQQGQKQERTEWHNVVVWGKQAETCGQYLSKGRQVFVEGSIRTRSYDDKDGNKKYITEIVA